MCVLRRVLGLLDLIDAIFDRLLKSRNVMAIWPDFENGSHGRLLNA